MRTLLIVNRRSRLGDTDLTEAVAFLEEHGFEVTERRPDDAAEAADVIRREGPPADLVILAGGDGTMNAAAEALVEAGVALAILPTGTGNDLARTLGIPTSIDDALRVIVEGHPHVIDLGSVNGKLFFNVASVGLSAQLLRHHTAERKRRFWLFAYVLSVIDAYKESRPFTARLVCDGRRRRVRAMQVSIGNGRHYGGGMTVAEDATIDDQRLDVYCIRPLGFWRLLALFPALRRGRLRRLDEILVLQGRRIELRTRRTMRVNADGEIVTTTPATFDLRPRALCVIVPATYAAGRSDRHAA